MNEWMFATELSKGREKERWRSSLSNRNTEQNAAKVPTGFCRPLKKFFLQIYHRPLYEWLQNCYICCSEYSLEFKDSKRRFESYHPSVAEQHVWMSKNEAVWKDEKKGNAWQFHSRLETCLFDWLCRKLMAFWEDSFFSNLKITFTVQNDKKTKKPEVEGRPADHPAEFM